MNLYRDEEGHWTGTQADAKLTGAPWALVEVPTDKYGLLSFLNNMEKELRTVTLEEVQPECLTADLGHIEEPVRFNEVVTTDIEPTPVVPEWKLTPGGTVRRIAADENTMIDEAILAADFPAAVRIAECAMLRVGEHLKDIAEAHLTKPSKGYTS